MYMGCGVSERDSKSERESGYEEVVVKVRSENVHGMLGE